MNTELQSQPPTTTPDSTPPESVIPAVPPIQESIITQSSSSSPKNNFMKIIIILLILAVLLIAGFFAYTKISGSKNVNSPSVTNAPEPSPTVVVSPTLAAAVTTVNPTLSTSDEIESLQKDVNGTDLTSMDQDAQQIDQNLQGL